MNARENSGDAPMISHYYPASRYFAVFATVVSSLSLSLPIPDGLSIVNSRGYCQTRWGTEKVVGAVTPASQLAYTLAVSLYRVAA